jgi:hypothetical protein
MYPSIVVVLVSEQRSMVETFEFSRAFGSLVVADPEHVSTRLEAAGQPSISQLPTHGTALEATPPGHPGIGSGMEDKSPDVIEKDFAAGSSMHGAQQIRIVP